MNRIQRGARQVKLSMADTFTLLNALSGFLGITYVLDGKYHTAALLLFAAVLFDGLDGMSYRRFGSRHTSGDKLDSIADSISFVIFPAIFLYSVYYDPARGSAFEDVNNALAVISAFAILFSGLYHLGLFITHGLDTFFPGHPTPLVSVLIIEAFFILPAKVTEIMAIVLAVSMVLPIKIPKVRGGAYLPVFIILIISTCYFVFYILGTDLILLLWLGFGATTMYAILSPFLARFV